MVFASLGSFAGYHSVDHSIDLDLEDFSADIFELDFHGFVLRVVVCVCHSVIQYTTQPEAVKHISAVFSTAGRWIWLRVVRALIKARKYKLDT